MELMPARMASSSAEEECGTGGMGGGGEGEVGEEGAAEEEEGEEVVDRAAAEVDGVRCCMLADDGWRQRCFLDEVFVRCGRRAAQLVHRIDGGGCSRVQRAQKRSEGLKRGAGEETTGGKAAYDGW